MTPLESQGRYLAHRCLAFERVLPLDDPDDPRWDKYVDTVNAYTRVQAQLTRPLAIDVAPRSGITRAPRRAAPPRIVP